MFRKKRQLTQDDEVENPFLLSFSDLMASLLAIFILALVVVMVQLFVMRSDLEEDITKTLQEINRIIMEIEKNISDNIQIQQGIANSINDITRQEEDISVLILLIKKDLQELGVVVNVSDNVMTIPDDTFTFDSGEYKINNRLQSKADAIGQVLLKVLSNQEHLSKLDTIFVEGHTDSKPLAMEQGNWGLSARRAISLWLYLTEKPGNFSELQNLKSRSGKPLFSVSGYADKRPIYLLQTDEVKLSEKEKETLHRQNRRIEFRFARITKERENLEKIKIQIDQLLTTTKELQGKWQNNEILKSLKEKQNKLK